MSAGSRIDSAYVPDHFAAVTGWVRTYDGLEIHRLSRRFVSGARKYSPAGTTSGSAVLAWE
jgi:hypothetical protein